MASASRQQGKEMWKYAEMTRNQEIKECVYYMWAEAERKLSQCTLPGKTQFEMKH